MGAGYNMLYRAVGGVWCTRIGMIAVIPAEKFKKSQALLSRADEKFHVIGRIVKPAVKNDPLQDRKVIYS